MLQLEILPKNNLFVVDILSTCILSDKQILQRNVTKRNFLSSYFRTEGLTVTKNVNFVRQGACALTLALSDFEKER